MQEENGKGLAIPLAFIALLFLSSLSLSMEAKSQPISINVMPQVPREGTPLFINLKLHNPGDQELITSYELYGNGRILIQGKVSLAPESEKTIIHLYPHAPGLGERVTFHARARSAKGSFEKTVSTPAYPPQVWSGFVSFASFSSSLMGSSLGSSMGSSMGTSISTIQFYKSAFTDNSALNIGLLFSIVLISLLIFLELTEPIHLKGFKIKGLRTRFGRLSTILFMVFIGMVFTKVVMIVG